jgi:hypothetical protein
MLRHRSIQPQKLVDLPHVNGDVNVAADKLGKVADVPRTTAEHRAGQAALMQPVVLMGAERRADLGQDPRDDTHLLARDRLGQILVKDAGSVCDVEGRVFTSLECPPCIPLTFPPPG